MSSTPAILAASVDEEDITRNRPRAYDDDLDSPPPSSLRKGKQREPPYIHHEDSSTIQLTDSDGLDSGRTSSTYPPVNDAQEETRRIQENLKRWEQAELQRRKSARQSSSGGAAPSSNDGSPSTRRTSLLWSVGKRASTSLHAHKTSGSASTLKAGSYAALPPATDTLPLTSTTHDGDHIPMSTTSTPTPTTTSFASSSQKKKSNPKQPEDDPFNPPTTPGSSSAEQHLLSPFADPQETPGADQTSALALAQQEQLDLDHHNSTGGTKAGQQQYISRQPPPPRPLGLPPPKSPPPPLEDDYEGNSSSAPGVRDGHTGVGQTGKTRWWHEWLCGCGEGPDRGGDHQAGKTNPFE